MKKYYIELGLILLLSFCCSLIINIKSGIFEGVPAYLGAWMGHILPCILLSAIVAGIKWVFTRKNVFRFFLNLLWIIAIWAYIVLFH